MRVLYQAAACLLLGSCTTLTTPPTQEDVLGSYIKCQDRAWEAFPTKISDVVVTEEKTISIPMTCKMDELIKCESGGEKKVSAVKVTRDINATARGVFLNACK